MFCSFHNKRKTHTDYGFSQNSEFLRKNTPINFWNAVAGKEDAEIKLIEKLISVGHILDKNGAVSGRYGVFRYFYKFPISETNNNYYVFN